MPEADDLARLTLSRQTLAAYEANGLPGGRIDSTLRMLAEEILELRRIEARRKPATSTIVDLIARWELLRERVKARGH